MTDDLWQLLAGEEKRQREGLELIPSENYVSGDVLRALGTVFTNKYSEGYPRRRYYGGQEYTDQIEDVAIERAKQLFGADHANVQPLSGAIMNVATYFAWLEPGDTVLGMALDQGGHLTHGSPVTYMAKLYNFERYGIKDVETGEIDYNAMYETAKKTKPKIVLAGFSGYPRKLDWAKFAEIAKAVDAVAMADVSHIAGLIAGGVEENPFDYGFHVVTTTTHKSLRGPRGGLILSKGVVGNPLKAPEKTKENLPTLIDRSLFPGLQGGPLMNVVFAKGVAFGEALRPEFKTYAQQVVANAKRLADELMQRGFKLVTNGTDNHLLLVDVKRSFGINGKEAEEALDVVGLNANKNAIPFDTEPPFRPSGLRLGTPAITTRGLKEDDMVFIAEKMQQAIAARADEAKLKSIRAEVTEFALRFPLPNSRQ